ncbi:hypothetical protein CCP3SC15_730008 [Gammaproteobacteria bacterium]
MDNPFHPNKPEANYASLVLMAKTNPLLYFKTGLSSADEARFDLVAMKTFADLVEEQDYLFFNKDFAEEPRSLVAAFNGRFPNDRQKLLRKLGSPPETLGQYFHRYFFKQLMRWRIAVLTRKAEKRLLKEVGLPTMWERLEFLPKAAWGVIALLFKWVFNSVSVGTGIWITDYFTPPSHDYAADVGAAAILVALFWVLSQLFKFVGWLTTPFHHVKQGKAYHQKRRLAQKEWEAQAAKRVEAEEGIANARRANRQVIQPVQEYIDNHTCAACQAEPGQPCRSVSSTNFMQPIKYMHTARRQNFVPLSKVTEC